MSARKSGRLSTRTSELAATSAATSSTAASAPAAAASSSTVAKGKAKRPAEKSSSDGFEFSKKKKTTPTTDAATTADTLAPTTTPAAAAAATPAAPSAPRLSAPSYPSTKLAEGQSFTFSAPERPLADAVTQLCKDVFAHELPLVEAAYGPNSSHKGAKKGQLTFVSKACKAMADEILANMPTKLNEYLASPAHTEQLVVRLENPINQAHRDSIEKWTRLAEQDKAERLEYAAEKVRRTAALAAVANAPKVVGVIGAEDASFLAQHKGGVLSQQVSQALANAAVKGDATLHTLEQIETYVTSVAADQKVMSARINAEDKKAYGAAVDDPKALIMMMTQ